MESLTKGAIFDLDVIYGKKGCEATNAWQAYHEPPQISSYLPRSLLVYLQLFPQHNRHPSAAYIKNEFDPDDTSIVMPPYT